MSCEETRDTNVLEDKIKWKKLVCTWGLNSKLYRQTALAFSNLLLSHFNFQNHSRFWCSFLPVLPWDFWFIISKLLFNAHLLYTLFLNVSGDIQGHYTTQQVFEKTAGLFRPTSSKSANITQHCKKLHVENTTKEVKKKKKASWAKRISTKCGKPNWTKFAFGCTGKPKGLWFCFLCCIGLFHLLSFGEAFWWFFFNIS